MEFYKMLLETLIAGDREGESGSADAGSGDAVWELLKNQPDWELESGDRLYSGIPLPGQPQVRLYALPAEKQERLRTFLLQGERERDGAEIRNHRVRIETPEGGVKYIPYDYFFRKSPYKEILAQGPDLFYIATGFPKILAGGGSSEGSVIEAGKKQYLPPVGENFHVLLFETVPAPESLSVPPENPHKTPLNIYSGRRTVQDLLDDLMAFPEDLQLDYFQKHYLDRYHPEEGELAPLTREFIHSNLCNIIVVFNAISGAFGFIEQLYFSKPLDRSYLAYWEKNPGTRTGFEFLFCLAAHYDFEKRALEYIFAARETARKLVDAKFYKPDVYNIKAKAYIISEIYDELVRVFLENGFTSEEEVLSAYVREQEHIYRMISAFGGSEGYSALFALGQLYWDERNFLDAIREWQRIDPAFPSKSLETIMNILSGSEAFEHIVARIDSHLLWRNHEISRKLLDRLVKFQRWKKREKKAVAM